ncbi:MAG: helix-turn-helix transcriptional regulator [Anaeromyxobacteraceae bacterium]
MTGPEQSADGGLAAFGRHLVQERELRGLTREDVVRATRLPASAVEAIESGDAERTPHRAYVVVYLRGYAAAVGLDPDETVLRYEEAVGPRIELPPRRSSGLAVAIGVALGAALAVAAVVWWMIRTQ